jgi:septal ring factor EnvC (AmiA/AmiB activator)
MSKRTVLGIVLTMCVLVFAGTAAAQDKIQNYFNEAACKVKATDDPSQKREILSTRIQDMSSALEKVRSSSIVSESDRAAIDRTRATLQEKQNELAGTDGFTRVSDDQLNAFSDYIVQDMEQADKTITIGVVTALLIVIIIILVV